MATKKKPAKKKPAKKKPARRSAADRELDKSIAAYEAAEEVEWTKPTLPPKGSRRAELLSAILEDPTDDGARHAYADLLQEEGDPRGEYIALAMKKGLKYEHAARNLFTTYGKKRWANFGCRDASSLLWERGFIYNVVADPEEFVRAGPLLFQLEPIVEITPLGEGGQIDKVLALPLKIRHLCAELSNEADQRAVANATSLGNVRSVRIDKLGDRGAKIWAPSTGMPKLEEFAVLDAEISDEGFAALLAGKLFAAIRRIYVGGNKLTAASMSALVASPIAGQVTELGLSNNPIGDAGVVTLATATTMPNLQALYLGQSEKPKQKPQFGDAAADALVAAATTTFKKLKTLHVTRSLEGKPLARVKRAYGKRLSTE